MEASYWKVKYERMCKKYDRDMKKQDDEILKERAKNKTLRELWEVHAEVENCVFCEKLDAPKIQFKYNNVVYITDQIFDFTCANVMNDVKLKIKK